MSQGALSSLKVLEYGDFISAAYCTKLLADLGADVIKIEMKSPYSTTYVSEGSTGSC